LGDSIVRIRELNCMSYGYSFSDLLLSLYALMYSMRCPRSSRIDGGYVLFLPCGVCSLTTNRDRDPSKE